MLGGGIKKGLLMISKAYEGVVDDPVIETKSVFTSKTFWANVLALLAPILAAKGINLSPEYQAQLAEFLIVVVPLANIGLRFISTQPIHLIKPGPPPLTMVDMELVAEKVFAERMQELELRDIPKPTP